MSTPPFFQENVLLAPYSTFRIGGPARWFATVSSLAQFHEALDFCRRAGLPWLVLGNGSNCLFDDEGFGGAVLVQKMKAMRDLGGGRFQAEAGYSFARLGSSTAKAGWSGLEFASGIPGTVGGALYMNAGANGADTSAVLESVDFMHEDGTSKSYPKDSLSFGYRHSSFQTMKGVILSAIFRLEHCPTAKHKQHEILSYRTSTQPYGSKSAGCVFRNPEGSSAGRLIDLCGLKGTRVGGAAVSTMHGNFIVNEGGATAKDVRTLMALIQDAILEKYGVELRSEVCYIPYFPS